MKKPIAIACDAAGLQLKESMKEYLEQNGYTVLDFGTHTTESCDYPEYAKAACGAIQEGKSDLALLFCGTGVGMSIAANKMHGIRACACSDIFSAEMTRRHNNANVLCLGGRVIGPGLAQKLVEAFLAAPFEGGRHQRRIDQIMELEG
ncbi:ribose 5-phosphate isomerase B [Ruminococcaceae bacterium OttesenSCG-928-A16]|nr:ribose 5-phosphate isomerase B [Ruminococcaceae bacterium OttesenSCG-928-A16]